MQGVEAAYLARKAGWEVRVIDKKPRVPASNLGNTFVQADVTVEKKLDGILGDVDFIMPTLEDDDDCVIQDVSLSGLAVVSGRKYPIGRCLDVAIPYADEEYVGQMEVQCAHPFDEAKTRYGLLGVFDTEAGRNLQNGLTRMTLEIQQQHLKRILESN